MQQLCSNKVEEHLAHLGIVTSCPPTNFPPFSIPLPAIFYAQLLSCSENKMRTLIILYQTCTRTHTHAYTCTHVHTPHTSPSITKTVRASWSTTDRSGHPYRLKTSIHLSSVKVCIIIIPHASNPQQIYNTFQTSRYTVHNRNDLDGSDLPFPAILSSQRTDTQIPPVVFALHGPELKKHKPMSSSTLATRTIEPSHTCTSTQTQQAHTDTHTYPCTHACAHTQKTQLTHLAGACVPYRYHGPV